MASDENEVYVDGHGMAWFGMMAWLGLDDVGIGIRIGHLMVVWSVHRIMYFSNFIAAVMPQFLRFLAYPCSTDTEQDTYCFEAAETFI